MHGGEEHANENNDVSHDVRVGTNSDAIRAPYDCVSCGESFECEIFAGFDHEESSGCSEYCKCCR